MSEIKNSNGVITLTSSFINIESTGISGINLGATTINFNNATLTNITSDAIAEGTTNKYFNGKTTDELAEGITNKYFSGKTTDELPEGATNLYFSGKTSDDLPEGVTNLYFSGKTSDDLPEGTTNLYFNGKTTDALPEGTTNLYFNGKTTDELPEGATNLYFTNERGISAIEHSTLIQFLSPNTVEINHTDGSTGDFIIYQKGLTGNLVLQGDSTNVDAVYINAPNGGLLATTTLGIQLNAGTTSGIVVDNGALVFNAGVAGDIVLQAGQGNSVDVNGGRIVMDSLMQLPTFVNVTERDSIQQAVGSTADIAFIAGTQQLCIQDGTQWSNIQTINSTVNYRYYRWNINRVADFDVDSGIQASEFKFLNNGVDVDMSGITSTFYFTQDSYTDEDHPILNLIDGLTGTFWYANLATAGLTEPFNSAVYFEFDFGTPTTTNGYKLTTGPDASSRDPVEWTIEGTNNADGEWFVIDSISQSQRVLENVGRIQDITLQYNLDNKTQLTAYSEDLTLTSNGGKIIMDSLMTLPTFVNVGGRDSSINQVLGTTGDIAYLSGSKTLCIQDGLQWSKVEIPDTTVSFQKYRWNIKRINNWPYNYMTVSEFTFHNNGVEIDMTGAGVTLESSIPANGSNILNNLISGGYWEGIIAGKTPPFGGFGNNVTVIFSFPTPITTSGYKWTRGPDDYSPIEWTLDGSNDPTGNVWFEIANISQSENILQNVGVYQSVKLNYNINNKSQLNSYTGNLSINAVYDTTYPNGANIDINSGDANAGGLGGHIYLSSGIGRENDASGGHIQLQTGNGQRSGNGGNITLTSQNGGNGAYDVDTSTPYSAGSGGLFLFTAGNGGDGGSGVSGLATSAGSGGTITLSSGNGGNKDEADFAGNGGDFTINAGNCYGTGASPGDINITAGTNNTNNVQGNITFNSGLIFNNASPVYSVENLTTDDAISLVKLITTFDTTSDNITATLANGTEGQVKTLILKVKGSTNTVSLSPTTPLGFTSITLDTIGSCVTLLYTSSGWVIVNERNARVL